jgi:predicted nuclease of predicted toxin-antitoxin system
VTRFLLDANLSPRTAKYLSQSLGFDAVSLLRRGLGQLSDADDLQIAKRENRVIITLDRDFIEPWLATGVIDHGIIYLELSGAHRYVGSVNAILARFLVNQAPSVNLQKSIVIIRESEVRISTSD